jgi:hypothetical protein
MKQVLQRQDNYTYGKCYCCGKKFNRTTRGLPVGLGVDGNLYPTEFPQLDTDRTITFNVPIEIEDIVKLGMSCYRKKFENKII